MPLIKPRTRGKQLVRHIARLDRETNETLYAYAHFLGESTDYVLNQVIDTVLAQGQGVSGLARRASRVLRAHRPVHHAPIRRADHAARRTSGRTPPRSRRRGRRLSVTWVSRVKR